MHKTNVETEIELFYQMKVEDPKLCPNPKENGPLENRGGNSLHDKSTKDEHDIQSWQV